MKAFQALSILMLTTVAFAKSSNITSIAAGTTHVLAIENGKLSAIVGTLDTSAPPLRNMVAAGAGNNHFLALRTSGKVAAWGDNSKGQTNVPAGLQGVKAISVECDYNLALKKDGSVVAWGSTNSQVILPNNLSDIKAIDAGCDAGVALKNNGTVVAWGTGPTPKLSNVIAVAAGYDFGVALKNDGTVVAWGNNDKGQATVPVGLKDVASISAAGLHTLALKKDGTVAAWGNNSLGESTVPENLNNVKAVSAGLFTSFTLKENGAVVGWGGGQNNPTKSMVLPFVLALMITAILLFGWWYYQLTKKAKPIADPRDHNGRLF